MKNFLVLISVVVLFLGACKKDTPVLSAFEKLSFSEIKALEGQLTTNHIVVKSTIPETGLKRDAIIVYKTGKGNYGKMILVDAEVGPNATLTIDIVNYDGEGNLILNKKDLIIKIGEGCDLDTGLISDTNNEFFWGIIDDVDYTIIPEAVPGFLVYPN